jgi:hypothetical protein
MHEVGFFQHSVGRSLSSLKSMAMPPVLGIDFRVRPRGGHGQTCYWLDPPANDPDICPPRSLFSTWPATPAVCTGLGCQL